MKSEFVFSEWFYIHQRWWEAVKTTHSHCSNYLVESLGGVQEAQSRSEGGNQTGLCIILHGKCSLGPTCTQTEKRCPGWSEHWMRSALSPQDAFYVGVSVSAGIRMMCSPRNPWPSWPVMHMSCGCGIHSLPLQAWVNTAAIPGPTANTGGRKRL